MRANISIVLIAVLAARLAVARDEVDPEVAQQRRILELLDQNLNYVYEAVLSASTPEHSRDVRDAQRVWLRYRDAEVKAVDKRRHDGTNNWDSIREDDRRFRLKQLTLARIEELADRLPSALRDYDSKNYVGEYGVMIDQLGVSLDIKEGFDGFKAEAHRGIDGQSGSHFSIYGIARITAPRVLTISGTGRDAAKALMLGRQCILYWENYRFYLLNKY